MKPSLLLMLALMSACSARESVDGKAIEEPKATIAHVLDRANLLPDKAEDALNSRLAALEARTTDQVVVVTLPSLDGRSIEAVSRSLGNSWGVGQKGKNNGVLLVVAPAERKVRIQVGYGLEGKLTNAISARIIEQDILPHFRERQMEQGIAAGVDAVVGVLEAPQQMRKAA